MRRDDLVFLDSCVLASFSWPDSVERGRPVRDWARRLIRAGVRVFVPEIAVYELKRELIRARKPDAIRQLDVVREAFPYAPITTAAIDLAARFWAESRARGMPTGPDPALDGDAILAATAHTAAGGSRAVMVASFNLKHLVQFVPTAHWDRIEVDDAPDFLAFDVPATVPA